MQHFAVPRQVRPVAAVRRRTVESSQSHRHARRRRGTVPTHPKGADVGESLSVLHEGGDASARTGIRRLGNRMLRSQGRWVNPALRPRRLQGLRPGATTRLRVNLRIYATRVPNDSRTKSGIGGRSTSTVAPSALVPASGHWAPREALDVPKGVKNGSRFRDRRR